MLSQPDLTEALHDGLRAADPKCGRFCTSGAEIEDGNGYRIWHNGTGSRDTADEVVYATAPLAMSVEQLGARVGAWITSIHKGERMSLNAN
jgi:hypothetical protein